MFNQLSEIAPAGALIAAATWGSLSYFVTGPEVATRMAIADHVPVCEATLGKSFTSSSQMAIEGTQQLTELERQAQAAQGYVNSMRGQYGDLWDAYDALSGGALSRALREAENAARAARQARDRARQAIEAKRDAAVASAPDQCSCQVTAALNDSRNDWALYVGTFGMIEQSGVSEFPALMRGNARMCAERVQI